MERCLGHLSPPPPPDKPWGDMEEAPELRHHIMALIKESSKLATWERALPCDELVIRIFFSLAFRVIVLLEEFLAWETIFPESSGPWDTRV